MQSAKAAKYMGADRIIVHTGSAAKISRQEALALADNTLQLALNALAEAGYDDLFLCPETMGKVNQLGTLDEVIALCKNSDRLIPCLDFGHLYARSLGADEGEAFLETVGQKLLDQLGEDRYRHFHVHFSKIAFTDPGGEKNHLTLKDTAFGPDPLPFVQWLAKHNLAPRVICESAGTQAADAALLQQAYWAACNPSA